MKKYSLHIIWAIIAVVALVGGIFWGKSMAAASSTAARTGAGRFANGSGTSAFARGGGAAGGFTVGEVSEIGNGSLTLQLANGNSENVFYSSSTQVIVPQPTSISSIQSGTMVMIGGTQNPDGSMTATTIQVRGQAAQAQ